MPVPARYQTDRDYRDFVPVHVVWEITLACDLKCAHCGSRAGKRRANELSTSECLTIVDHLARLGTREISLIGGEAYLRNDWTEIVRAIRAHEIYCAIQTGGRNLTPKRLARAVEAGLQGVGVSIDGLQPLHDRVRGVRGSFAKAIDTLQRVKASGLNASVNTQIGAQTAADLPSLMDLLIDLGVSHWQVQLTVAMGNAVDNDDLLLQPYQLLELIPLLAGLYTRGLEKGLLLVIGNNIGYFGPYEHLWRGFGNERIHWSGCSAGHTAMGLEADGTVKGCPSLPTIGYSGGNVRDLTIADIWDSSQEIHFGRLRSVDDLWGFCRSCYYADVCRGGCTWTSHSLLGRPGNNPYCHHRVLALEKQGLRERVLKRREADMSSFAVGEFELITERIPETAGQVSEVISRTSARPNMVQLRPQAEPIITSARDGRTPPRLDLCRGCDHYIWPGEKICPHCGSDVATKALEYAADQKRRSDLMDEIRCLIDENKTKSQGRYSGIAASRS